MLRIFTNQLDASESETREYKCLLAEWLAIREQYPTARLYKDAICIQNDVTPKTRNEAWALREAIGLYQVVCHAGDPGTIGIIAAVLAVGTAVYTYMNMPEPPKDIGGPQGSPNNSLAQRQNKHRVGGRVPDIYGKVKTLPDLIAPVYRYYRDNVQIEECLLCIGSGSFEIDKTSIKEGETPISTIEGASISIYEPNTWLLSETPQIQIGEPFFDAPLVTKQVSSIDGKQKLIPPNNNRADIKGVTITNNDTLNFTNASNDITKLYETGENIIINNLKLGDWDLSGQYKIASVATNKISLVNPSSVKPEWSQTSTATQAQQDALKALPVELVGSQENYIGWYYAGSKESTGFILNFVAQNGLYEGNYAKDAVIEIEYQMVVNGQGVGEIVTYTETMTGIANNRNTVAITIRKDLPGRGAFRFRARRTNDNGNSQNLIDDVTFESAYSCYETERTRYPLDTIVRLRRMAIGSGTNASELNLVVGRKVYTPNRGFALSTDFADIVRDIAIDPYLGRMRPEELDAQALYDVSSEIAGYFGTDKACEFNYTFDDTNASYQEMVFTVADSVFCNARRENGQHYFMFERETPNSLLLFNHRNMKPESLSVGESFGIKDGLDGIELKWRDPNDNYAEAVIKLPDHLRTNYKTIETRGVTNYAQAWFLANRAWNKLKYGRKMIEFTAYGEADLVTRMDRIAVVDSTVPILCAGEIEAHDNLVLTLDYPLPSFDLTGLTIHLQLKNGVVDVIDIASIIDEYTVQLARIPMQPLVVAGVTHTTFAITQAKSIGFDAYLIEEKSASSMFESSITATKYDPRYYQNDSDYKNGLLSPTGTIPGNNPPYVNNDRD